MAKKSKKKCTLKFQSKGDLLSALNVAKKYGIPAREIGGVSEHLISVPADKVITLQGSGGVHFGFIEVCV